MTVSRPPELRVGDEVRIDGAVHTITALSGLQVHLVDVTGGEVALSRADLFTAPGFCVVTQTRASLPPQGLLDGLPADALDEARWWERHVVEVITGVPPEAGRGVRPKPEYDPQTRTLRQRELAKVAELAAAGHKTPLSTLQRLRLSYAKHGVWGLVDRRTTRQRGTTTDARVLEAIRQAIAEETNRSTGTVGRLRRRVEQILTSEHGLDPSSVMPARATFYRLAERISAGKPATEAEIAAAAAALLDRAEHGPATPPERPPTPPKDKRSRRVSGRTKATNSPTWPRPDTDDLTTPSENSPDGSEGEHIAKVIPLGVFDPFEEASKRW